MKQLYFLIYSLLLTIAAQGQTTLVQWNFNSTTPDSDASTGTTTPNINVASGTIIPLGTTTTFASGSASGGSTDPTPTDDSGYNLTGFPAQSTDNLTEGLGVGVSTTGYQNIRFSFDLRYSNRAAKLATVQYSIDGGTTWTGVGSVTATAGDTWQNGNSFTLPTDANNIANLQLRVVSTFSNGSNYEPAEPTVSAPGYATTGTWRFDMVTVLGDAPLPVNLVSFTGKSGNKEVLLNWVTAWERQNEGFNIQKSTNGQSFESIGFVPGNTTTQLQSVYEFRDADVMPGTLYYYRLKQNDIGGGFALSKIIAIRANAGEAEPELLAYPNPSRGSFTLSGQQQAEAATVKLYTATGVEMPIRTLQTGNSKTLDITTTPGLAPGLYYLKVNAVDGSKPKLLKVLIY